MIIDDKIKQKNKYLVLTRLAAIEKMSLIELKKEWGLYHNGAKAPGYGRQFLIRKLAWRIQETYYGGLSTELSSKLREIAQSDSKYKLKNENTKEARKGNIVLPGTRFVRTWNGQRIEVVTLEKGFQYNNQVYRSLSSIAKEITGTNWNGKIFFGLKS